MILSMTGFGRGSAESSERKFTIEIKSLNSKQLDLSMRLPSNYREMEIRLRNDIAKSLIRGKVELNANVENIVFSANMKFNRDVMASYLTDAEATCKEIGINLPEDIFNTIVRLPDAMTQPQKSTGEGDEAALTEAVNQALKNLVEFRSVEGERLESFFREKIERISALLGEIEPMEAERIPKLRQKLDDQLNKLDFNHNPERLEQELIFYIEKLDVTEEKTRLRAHLKYFIETLEGESGQGKKLGFIAQEIGREINTLGSKSNHAGMQRTVVMMKDELEQIKEQVLNVL